MSKRVTDPTPPADEPSEAAKDAAARLLNKMDADHNAEIRAVAWNRCVKSAALAFDAFAARARAEATPPAPYDDTARLDWLDEVNRRANARNRTTYGWKYDINHNRASLTDHNWPPLSIREAIDNAREVKVEATPPAASDLERARNILRGWWECDDPRALSEIVGLALAEGKSAERERCAKIAESHPFKDDASAGCADAQGCCEDIAGEIRAPTSPTRKGE